MWAKLYEWGEVCGVVGCEETVELGIGYREGCLFYWLEGGD